ncbi:MAG: PKD domain-containing protein [Bacteroidetes bacterium]|jgi:glucose/arabinose dehydrogenase|nr:PKD domain-containing protein [Bacteroidota bacterium]
MKHLLPLAFLCTLLFALPAQELPDGFFDISYLEGLDFPTGLTFDDNGRLYVWEKKGIIHVTDEEGNLYPEPFLDISEQVSNWKDHGLMDMVLDNDFLANGYFYVLYAVDRHHYDNYGTPAYHPDSTVTWAPTFGRVVRYRADPTTAYLKALPDSEHILLGATHDNGIPLMYEFHGLGTLLMAEDGTLLISTGDATSGGGTDIGGDEFGTMASAAIEAGIITEDQDIGSYRSQYLGNYNGKVLRIDAESGEGLPSNPFYEADRPTAPQSRIWAWGFRNPYRMQLRPNSGSHYAEDGQPGVLFVGDVGNGAWEELDIVDQAGQNFGWPIMEGIGGHWPYMQETPPANQMHPNPLYEQGGCDEPYFNFQDLYVNPRQGGAVPPSNPCNTEVPLDTYYVGKMPALAWSNARWNKPTRAQIPVYGDNGYYKGLNIDEPAAGLDSELFDGYSALSGVFYQGDNFPAKYQGKYFMVDFSGWIKMMEFDESHQLVSIEPFHDYAKDIIHLEENPADGKLYYLNLQGQVRQISFGGNPPPVAVIEADRFYGPGPLEVQFDGSSSYDSNLPIVAYEWDFGDGTSDSGPQPRYTFSANSGAPTSYTVTLTVTDSLGETATSSRIVSLNNTPPSVQISSFDDGDRYPIGQGTTLLRLAADVEDEEHGLEELQHEWRVFLHHNDHYHPEPVDFSPETFTLISPLGCQEEEYWYRIELTITDPEGLSTMARQLLYPYCEDPFVEWAELELTHEAGGLRLNWTTAMEDQLAYFELQRSGDRYLYDELARIPAEGPNGYQYFDEAPLRGNNFYRVKAVSQSGAYLYSNTVFSSFPIPPNVQVFPNPARDHFTVKVREAQSEELSLQLYDEAGRPVMQAEWEAAIGERTEKELLTHRLPNGLYYYTVQQGKASKHGSIIINR